MNKRGMNEVVTTVLIILLVLAAVIIIWSVLRPMIQKSSEQIESDSLTASLKILPDSVMLNPITQKVIFKVQRGTEDTNIIAIEVRLEDINQQTQSFRQNFPEGFKELESKIIAINYSSIGSNTIKRINIYPVILSNSGKEITSSISAYADITQNNLFNGLVAYWKFDETSYSGAGNEVKDVTGNHDGRALYNLTTVSGKLGNAGRFDGNKSQVLVANSTSLDFSKDMTLLLWINHKDRSYLRNVGNGGNQAIIAKTYYNYQPEKILAIWPQGSFREDSPLLSKNNVLGYGGSDSQYYLGYPNGPSAYEEIDADKWYHIGVSYNNATHNTILYINGNPAPSYFEYQTDQFAPQQGHQAGDIINYTNGIAEFHPRPDNPEQVVRMGVFYDNNWHYSYEGLMDEIMFFNKTLSNEEVAKIYNYYQ